jgi:uncharacterized Fe-S radical SAM superfamily protein PflX
MVRRRQIEKRTDRLRQLGGDNAKSVAEQCDIHMHSLLKRCELSSVRCPQIWNARQQIGVSGVISVRKAVVYSISHAHWISAISS